MGEQHFSGLKTEKIEKFTEYLEDGNYEKFPSDILLGQKGAFVILDENLRLVYRSKSNMPKRFTEEELFFINELDKKEKIKAVFYQDENENDRILIQREKNKEDMEKNKKESINSRAEYSGDMEFEVSCFNGEDYVADLQKLNCGCRR